MAKSSGKLTKIKVPKRVAGVKIPKTMRKGPVMEFVNSSAGKLLIAEALTAALAVFAYKHVDSDTGRRIKEGAHDAEAALKRNTARLTRAFGDGVRAFRESLSRSNGHGETAAGNVIDQEPDALEAAKKKPSSPSQGREMADGL